MDPLGGTEVARVAVVERVADERPRAIEPADIHAPRVDADARQAGCRTRRQPKPGQDLVVQAQRVPVQPVGKLDRVVREAVYLLERQAVRAEPAEDDPAARGADVDGCDDPFVHSGNVAIIGRGFPAPRHPGTRSRGDTPRPPTPR